MLFAAIGAVMYAGGFTAIAPAQVKDKDKDKSKTKAMEELGVAEIYEAKDGWRFRIKNPEGKSIAIATTGLDTKEEVMKNLDLIKATLNKSKPEVIKKDKK